MMKTATTPNKEVRAGLNFKTHSVLGGHSESPIVSLSVTLNARITTIGLAESHSQWTNIRTVSSHLQLLEHYINPIIRGLES